jgi:hypothetical protein
MATEWRQNLITEIISIAKTKGGGAKYSYDLARNTLDYLAEIDRGKEPKQRIGANWFLNDYKASDRAIRMLMNEVNKNWSDVGPKQENIEDPQTRVEISSEVPDFSKIAVNDYFLQCVISIRLKQGKKLGINEVRDWISKHQKSFRINHKVQDCIEVVDRWCDIKISYSMHLAKIYDALFDHPDVEDVITKPTNDFGRRTIAYKRTYV